MSAQAAPFAVLTDIAQRSRSMAAGLPEQQEVVELWNGIGFVLSGQRYVAPMGEVTEILHVPRFTRVPGVRSFLLGAANVRGRLLPLVDLASFFEIPRSSRSQRERRVLVVEQGEIFSGLVVDSVLGMQYFAADSFRETPDGVPDTVRPFVTGGYERNEEVWNVFSAADLVTDERFLDVAQW
ncbi:chemotaxis protein CheW [Marinobacter lutaoensis]|jgi:twitching motility protein PilI|uniref:Chemotaxis protein CheW n=1 Tax=Marinobacter lutaoensis TaxID=135739 RepID=A0A1V2DNX4_9GAMM|nr:chemotaxis protein CheW [Marinobacter lutaoensis]MBI43238.1 chemotaxis protein CheW [Oceanospirillales bacterium]MBI43790.1 chemotaxis protein CheW [Oceanospirillales bacterium]NVD35688.1 purine-binding chemotaxis protein CheW [Marinobacter lutaoensis]ONF42240.1 chemotaxis protein CheW [Marinobacter lutaoensis]|tara:strand:- start:24689 stop:25234 length:546 start_codon:yes stop_codon:yes gene_type:complete